MKAESLNRKIEHMLVRKYSHYQIAWFIMMQLGKTWYDSLFIAQNLISKYKEEV
jgi:hypothetical protein